MASKVIGLDNVQKKTVCMSFNQIDFAVVSDYKLLEYLDEFQQKDVSLLSNRP